MIMNRKIFTLLAVALMLFSTAFYANARSVAESSVGDLVKTLPRGTSLGMYHIQIDSICLPDYVAGVGNTGKAVWIPATFDGGTSGTYFQYDANSKGYAYVNTNLGDTMVLSVTEGGYVRMISASDLRDSLSWDKASLIDLQATMWCIDIQEDADFPQWPTYHFTNKVYGEDLDWAVADRAKLDGNDKGWLYSPSYDNGQLKNKMPFHRERTGSDAGNSIVVVAELDDDEKPTGLLKTISVTNAAYVADTIVGLLKFSIVKISPFVMTAEDFNSQLGNTDGSGKVKLNFDPEPIQDNPFGYKLVAETSANNDNTTGAARFGYLNVGVYDENDVFKGYIANSNKGKTADGGEKYNNVYGTEYLNLLVKNGSRANDRGEYNYSYRFVYFPSEDSLVINAFYAKHDVHNDYASLAYEDNGNYFSDKALGLNPFYYGLYNDTIHDALIVRLQDLNGINGATSLMTIGKHPANVRMYLGINSCQENIVDAWQVPEGVYTIWDTRGRCLGVRIYNGSYSPQWIELDEGECPDRIPSYQWVIQHTELSSNRIDIHNREFGSLSPSATQVDMLKVLVKRGTTQIFKNQSQFKYDPIILGLYNRYGYEPIVNGYVNGRLIPAIEADACVVKSESGFRPVTNAYVTDQYLGYKHFHVDSEPTSPGLGKSEDIGSEKGMDYNAYAFNYLYYQTERGYIDTQSEYNDTLLHISTKEKTGFQFMLGTYLRNTGYQEEIFGYPRTAWGKTTITDNGYTYDQTSVPVLKRYYYELKVADFYNYRDGLAEEFVVLKGAKEDGSDLRNKLKYGLADVWADKDPFKFANIYLRESYFLERDLSVNEERHIADPSRRIFYILLDRIEASQLDRVTSEGFEVSDTLKGEDGTSTYNLVTIKVEDAIPSFLKAQGKVVSTARASAFALENINYPLYRRLRSIRDDGAKSDEQDKTGTALDAPKTLRIHRHANYNHFLHEDRLSADAYNYGINFLGHSTVAENPEKYAPDGTVKYNYHLFIDTAYINRGTGWIKPQYLIAVGQKVVESQTVSGVDGCGDPVPGRTIMPYVIGRYLINATDSARILGSDGSNSTPDRDKRYILPANWDRLAFVPAIHVDDRLYIISEMEKRGVTEADYIIIADDGEKYVDGDALRKLTLSGGKLANSARTPTNSFMYGAYYDFGVWDNYHNDVSFSLRFTHPNVANPDENGQDLPNITNEDKRFYIESETTDRTIVGNRKIAPVRGGWVKLENFVPVLSRTSYSDNIKNAEIYYVALPTSWQDGVATSNEEVTSKVNVIAGTDEIIILNAANKQVTVTNLLGQTLVNKALKGNNEKISVAKGIVIVNVEGEKAVKAIIN
jgi:hypothetical protein